MLILDIYHMPFIRTSIIEMTPDSKKLLSNRKERCFKNVWKLILAIMSNQWIFISSMEGNGKTQASSM